MIHNGSRFAGQSQVMSRLHTFPRQFMLGSRRVAACSILCGLLVSSVSLAAKSSTGDTRDREPLDSYQIVSLEIIPPEMSLSSLRGSQRFVVLATCADGLKRDVTEKCDVSVMDQSVARVGETNRLRAVAQGRTRLEVVVAGWRTSSTILVDLLDRADRPVTFERDVVRILTKRGCNGSDCHGGVIGRGGLKFSLDAIEPGEDYEWIRRGGGYQVLSGEPLEPIEPRIDLAEPARSLLLLKPTETEPHEGGLRFEKDSSDYQTLLEWIRQGALFKDEETPQNLHVERIEVFPELAVLKVSGNHRILVTAHWSNGRSEDITDHVRYEALQPETLTVSEGGIVRGTQGGTATILVRAVGHVSSAQFRVIESSAKTDVRMPTVNFIDEHVFHKLEEFRIRPSEPASDPEFLRRICLDLTGTLPPPALVRTFLDDGDPDKRERLIDALLESPEFTEFWTFRFADLYRVGGDYGWVHLYWEWVRSSVAQNKPYDQMAREVVAAQGYSGPSRAYLLNDNKPVPVQRMVAEQFRVFMGRRLDCAECHNHAYDRWSQNQFWGLAAFYGRLTNTQWFADNVVFDDPRGHEIDCDEEGAPLAFRRVLHPRTKLEVDPRFPDGQSLPEEARDDPRAALAAWMTSQDAFAEATVNRIWKYFFGRGFVDPVDDFRATNPPSHPGLLAAMAKDFVDNGYNLRHLMRRIVRSRTYQLSSTSNASNRQDMVNYSHAQPRRLEAEVLLDAICSATGVPEILQGNGVITGAAPPGTRAINLKLPASYSSRFLEVYGRPLRNTLPVRDDRANLVQALHMLVGSTYTKKLGQAGGRVDQLVNGGGTDGELIEELYLATLTRRPTPEEASSLEDLVTARDSRADAFTDLMWALLCSREFCDNH